MQIWDNVAFHNSSVVTNWFNSIRGLNCLLIQQSAISYSYECCSCGQKALLHINFLQNKHTFIQQN